MKARAAGVLSHLTAVGPWLISLCPATHQLQLEEARLQGLLEETLLVVGLGLRDLVVDGTGKLGIYPQGGLKTV